MVESFGLTKAGAEARLFTLKNGKNINVLLSDFGATLAGILVPDQEGQMVEVTLGYDDVSGYEAGDSFFGAIVGRVANRIGKATFELNGQHYQLTANDHQNNLHSGPDFFSKRLWEVLAASESEVTFGLKSPEGDQGYPGAADICVTYSLSEENELKIEYQAVPSADTLLNMTNHSFFNLNGDASGDILEQSVWIDAAAFTPTDAELIPTGAVAAVADTPLDFNREQPVGRGIAADFEALQLAGGYDQNFVLNGEGYRKVASLSSARTGIRMEVYTDLPGLQLYSGNFIDDVIGRGGVHYRKRQGICFETQYFPDAVNQAAFTAPITRAGAQYRTTTAFKFSYL